MTRSEVLSIVATDAEGNASTPATVTLNWDDPAGFPGQPPAGKLIWGSSAGGRTAPKLSTYPGINAHRAYYSANGSEVTAMVAQARTDQAAGMLHWPSFYVSGWANMASGGQDAFLHQLADACHALPFPIWVTLSHEPENDTPGQGSVADWAAMQAHAGPILHTAPNVAYAPIFMYGSMTPAGQSGFTLAGTYTDQWDFIGVDHYPGRLLTVQPDIGGSPGLTVISKTVKPFGKLFAMGEWAYKATTYTTSPGGNPGAIGRTVDQMLAVGNCVGGCYFDSHPSTDVAHWEFNGAADPRLADFQSALTRPATQLT